jgi:hypothetical protein
MFTHIYIRLQYNHKQMRLIQMEVLRIGGGIHIVCMDIMITYILTT